MAVLYGIKSCDSCRAALKWLRGRDIDVSLHDFRVNGLEVSMLERWCKALSWEALLNKRSLTWRRIPEADRGDLDQRKAISLMLEHPTLIKRPVLEQGKYVVVGFSPDDYERLLGKKR